MADQQLSWVLELESKLGGAMSMVRELRRVDSALGDVDSSLKRVERGGDAAFGGLGRKAQGFARSAAASFVGNLGALAAWEGVKRLAGGFVDLASGAVAAAEGDAKLERSFASLLGEADGLATMKWLDKLALQIPGTNTELREMVRELVRVGVAKEDLEGALLTASDRAVSTGQSPQEIVSAFAEVQRSGEITSRSLKSLGLTEAEAFDPLMKALGLSKTAIQELMADGKIGGEQARRSLQQAIKIKSGGTVGKLAMEGGATIGEKVRDLTQAKDDLLSNIGKSLAPLGTAFGPLIEAMGPEGSVGAAVGGMAERLGKKLGEINWKEGAETLLKTLEVMIDLAGDFADGIAAALKPFLWLLDKVGVTDSKGQSLASDPEVTGLREHGLQLRIRRSKQFGGQGPAPAGGREEYDRKWNARWGLGEEGRADSRTLGADSAKGYAQGAAAVMSSAPSIGQQAEEKTRADLQIHSPSKAFAELGEHSAEGFAGGFGSKSQKDLASLLPDPIPAPSSYASTQRAGGGGSVSVNLTVNYEGKGGEGDADDLANRIRAILPSALHNALEQMSAQVGATA